LELAVDLAAPATSRRLAVHLLRVDLAATLGPDQGRPGGGGVEPGLRVAGRCSAISSSGRYGPVATARRAEPGGGYCSAEPGV